MGSVRLSLILSDCLTTNVIYSSLSNCTYTFSPLTGLIVHHSVDSIEPAPHQALFEALGKFGLLEGGLGPKAGGVGS
jgi:hypothetical protein